MWLYPQTASTSSSNPPRPCSPVSRRCPPRAGLKSPDWLARLRAAAAADPWTHGFAMVERVGGAAVGSCGYKGPPGPEGVVEIAYGVEPDHRGRGYATEAAGALVAFAFAGSLVRLVRAHTQPGNGASARVLTKCGFARVGEVVDPEDGLVWRWERNGEPPCELRPHGVP